MDQNPLVEIGHLFFNAEDLQDVTVYAAKPLTVFNGTPAGVIPPFEWTFDQLRVVPVGGLVGKIFSQKVLDDGTIMFQLTPANNLEFVEYKPNGFSLDEIENQGVQTNEEEDAAHQEAMNGGGGDGLFGGLFTDAKKFLTVVVVLVVVVLISNLRKK